MSLLGPQPAWEAGGQGPWLRPGKCPPQPGHWGPDGSLPVLSPTLPPGAEPRVSGTPDPHPHFGVSSLCLEAPSVRPWFQGLCPTLGPEPILGEGDSHLQPAACLGSVPRGMGWAGSGGPQFRAPCTCDSGNPPPEPLDSPAQVGPGGNRRLQGHQRPTLPASPHPIRGPGPATVHRTDSALSAVPSLKEGSTNQGPAGGGPSGSGAWTWVGTVKTCGWSHVSQALLTSGRWPWGPGREHRARPGPGEVWCPLPGLWHWPW